jgi:hypothetical protein
MKNMSLPSSRLENKPSIKDEDVSKQSLVCWLLLAGLLLGLLRNAEDADNMYL